MEAFFANLLSMQVHFHLEDHLANDELKACYLWSVTMTFDLQNKVGWLVGRRRRRMMMMMMIGEEEEEEEEEGSSSLTFRPTGPLHTYPHTYIHTYIHTYRRRSPSIKPPTYRAFATAAAH